MSHLISILLFSVLLLVSACTESVQQPIDSSAATTVASTVGAQSNFEQQPTIADEPTAISIFCPECQLVEVTGIVDGDTIDTSIGRVRFFGVNTPERGKSCFTEATEFSRLLIGPRLERYLRKTLGLCVRQFRQQYRGSIARCRVSRGMDALRPTHEYVYST